MGDKLFVRSSKSKFSIMSKIWLGAVVLAVIVGLGAAAHAGAASSSTIDKKLLLDELSLFNPFTLQSMKPAESGNGTEADSGPIVLLGAGPTSRPPIRIPYRPPLRSPFRPPL
jgi:hypothetical protein